MRFEALAFAISLTMGAAAASQSSEDIAYFHLNRVKPSMTVQYEMARKRHWVWHQKMGDTWSFHVWQIVWRGKRYVHGLQLRA